MESAILSRPYALKSRLYDYALLTKFKLASLVVFSAAMGFLTAPGPVDWPKLLMLIIGGFLVTASSNGLNQVIEKDLDKLMNRTAMRPLPDSRLTVNEALILCVLSGAIGIFILTFFLNITSGILGLFALLSYTFAYTPLKRVSPFSVFVGAFPGAVPPLLGWVAATGHFGIEAWVLFAIQFIWQFPHFWSIAWVLDDDYKKAGFIMLPTGKRDKGSALQTFVYTISLLPIGFMPFMFNVSGWISLIVIMVVTVYFTWAAFQLFANQSIATARKLMFASFIYLPVVQLVIALDSTHLY